MLPGGSCNLQQSVKALKMLAMSKTETGANQYSPKRIRQIQTSLCLQFTREGRPSEQQHFQRETDQELMAWVNSESSYKDVRPRRSTLPLLPSRPIRHRTRREISASQLRRNDDWPDYACL